MNETEVVTIESLQQKIKSLEKSNRNWRRKVQRLRGKSVTKGKWEICCDGYYPYCSKCGYEPPWLAYKDNRTPFCPNCGAEMSK